jgi:hypothetical protein
MVKHFRQRVYIVGQASSMNMKPNILKKVSICQEYCGSIRLSVLFYKENYWSSNLSLIILTIEISKINKVSK